MWKVKYLGNGYYSIRPLHELFYGLWRSDASSNELMIYNIGTTDTVSGVFSNAQWSITGSSGNYAIRKHGDSDKTLYLTTTTSQEVVKCGTGTNNDYSKWNFKPVSSPPQGAYLCKYNSSASAYRVVTNPTRYVAPGETRTLEDMKLRAIAYSPNTISQTFTCASSDTNVATVNAYGAVTGVSPSTAIITGTSSCGETTRFTVSVTEIANGTYFLKNKETNRYADIENHTMSGGTQIEQQDFDGGNSQRWIFTHLGDGYYSIKSANSASTFYMGVSGDSTGNDVPVVLRAASLTDGAKWRISTTSSGAYKITAKTGEANNRVLAVGAYVLNTNGVDIEQRESANPTNYRDEWILSKIGAASSVSLEGQKKSNWCWAASSRMFSKHFYDAVTYTQNQAVAYIKGSEINDGGTIVEIMLAIEYYISTVPGASLNLVNTHNKIYTESTLMEFLNDGYVVAISRGWYSDIHDADSKQYSHATLLIGYVELNGEIWFIVHDPSPVDIGETYFISYEKIVNGRDAQNGEIPDTGVWTDCVVVDTPYCHNTIDYFFGA